MRIEGLPPARAVRWVCKLPRHDGVLCDVFFFFFFFFRVTRFGQVGFRFLDIPYVAI
jgi:hypothetical protein